MNRSKFADILLPLPIEPLTYEVGEIEGLRVGECVAVKMGDKSTKVYTGIVWRVHDEQPPYERIRTIIKRVYDRELLSSEHRKFWEWLADYYLCTMGEVMRVALPSLVKPVAEDEEAFELAEYTPTQEYYIATKEGVDASKLRGKQAESYEKILSIRAEHRTHNNEIPRRLLRCELQQLRGLSEKGLIELNLRDRTIESVGRISFDLPTLTPHQEEALATIREGHKEKICALLHGVTGSGKTEIYIHLIAEQLAAGRDVLMLVPEIALTTQLIERMREIFGSRVTPYHSKVLPRRRTELFMQLTQSREGGNFVVGARSALFLPLNNLGLIIVDEEHDSSFKQIDPAPRYNARDSAHVLASMFGAKTLLGSATPSLESWTNATTGKFAMARLTERYGRAELPTIILSDTRRAAKRRERNGHFNIELTTKIIDRTLLGEQTMLFQNRRGFAPYVECGECGWVARCPHCNVSLTMHKSGSSLRCHYCDYSTPLVAQCPNCKGGELRPMGFGTEKIEEQLSEIVPEARVVRMDRDTASSPTALERIVGSFARGESDVMVGTQMIAKGFDFSGVTLVGILNADNMLLSPDFRAEERAFSLMTQVAGRAGRRAGSHSEVVIQSSQPTHRVLQYVVDNDYDSMARALLEEREAYLYPPYSRITMIILRHRDLTLLHRGANALSALLRERFGMRRIRGPVPPPVERLRGEWIVNFMVKIESGASSKRAREVLREVVGKWRSEREFNTITLSYNVDPQ
ncbi:MAG: primosomal protein N' [Rikenellaceae bacterium]